MTLQLMGAPNGLDLAFISPYDGRIRVPPFDNEQDNYDPVVVVKHGDKAVLESGSGMIALHATVDHAAAAPKKKPAPQPHPTSRNRRNYLPSVEYGSPRLLTVAQNTVTPPAAAADASPSMQNCKKPHWPLPRRDLDCQLRKSRQPSLAGEATLWYGD